MTGSTSDRQFSFDDMVRNLDSETIIRIRSGTITQAERRESPKLDGACIFWETRITEGREVGVEYPIDPKGVIHMRV